MFDMIRAESPLAASTRARVEIREIPFLGYVNLRGSPQNPAFLAAAERVLAMKLPLASNTVTRGHELSAAWLGPDEWLVITAPRRETQLVQSLCEALAGQHAAVTDVSSGQTTVGIGGRHARDVLAKGCTLDLHARAFGTGRCAQTLLAKAGVLIQQTNDVPTFHVGVRRSFAQYLWAWLEDAAEEYRHL